MSLTIVPNTTALVLIDLQNGIVSRVLTPHDAGTVVTKSVRLGEALGRAGGTIIPVHVAFSAGGADRLKQPVDSPMPVPPGGIPADWSDLTPQVAQLPAALVITKRQWSAF